MVWIFYVSTALRIEATSCSMNRQFLLPGLNHALNAKLFPCTEQLERSGSYVVLALVTVKAMGNAWKGQLKWVLRLTTMAGQTDHQKDSVCSLNMFSSLTRNAAQDAVTGSTRYPI